MAKAKAKVVTKIKKKFWYPIIAPKIFSSRSLGEIYLEEPQVAMGRTLKCNLRDLTGNMRDQNVYLTFKINNVANNTLNTDIVGYQLTPASVKRAVRRFNDRSDDSFVVATSDNKRVRLKTFILTIHNTKHSISSNLKRTTINYLTEEIKKINFGNLIDKLISHKLQSDVKKRLTKIYPLKVFEIKFMGLEKGKGQKTEEEATPETVVSEEAPVETPETEEKTEEKPKKTKKKEEEEEITEAIEEAETQKTEEAVEEAVEEVEELPEEQAEEAAEELVEGKEE